MKYLGNRIKKIILDLVFPIKCIGCQREGQWLCQRCLYSLRPSSVLICPNCKAMSETGATCRDCRRDSSLDGLLVVFEDNRLIRQLVNRLKYYFITDLVGVIEPKLNNFVLRNPWLRDFCVLAPVPLHRRRFLERGFNQSQLLAESVSRLSGSLVKDDLLIRTTYHHRQVGLSSEKRQANIAGSFRVNEDLYIKKNQTIVLVDDVYTTGATMGECARELKKVGYKKVWGIVLVRG